MLTPNGPAPQRPARVQDRLPLPELCAEIFREAGTDPTFSLEWLLDRVCDSAERTQRLAR